MIECCFLLLTIMYKLVSSAKSLIFAPISFTILMSLIYSRKNRGLRIEPRGTPACMYTESEVVPGITTLCFQSSLSRDTSSLDFVDETAMPNMIKSLESKYLNIYLPGAYETSD